MAAMHVRAPVHRGLDHSQKRSLNLFIWPKQKSKQAPITIVLGDSEHHARSSSRTSMGLSSI